MDDAIAQMVAFTDTTPERAAQYLQIADGDVNQAVSLFFESGGVDLSGQPPVSSNPPASAPAPLSGTGNAQNPISIDDDNISDDNDPEITGFSKKSGPSAQPLTGGDMEDDEAMARRLQEEMYGQGGDDEPLRAPIARQTETLLGPGASDYYGGGSVEDAIQERMHAMQSRRGGKAQLTIAKPTPY